MAVPYLVQFDEGDCGFEMLISELIVEAAGDSSGYDVTEEEVAGDEESYECDTKTSEDYLPFSVAAGPRGQGKGQRRRSG